MSTTHDRYSLAKHVKAKRVALEAWAGLLTSIREGKIEELRKLQDASAA